MPDNDSTSSRKRDSNLVGWYVDVPRELKEQFDKLWPQRGANTKLTIAAIKYAIQQRDLNEAKSDRTLRVQQGDASTNRPDHAGMQEDGTVVRECCGCADAACEQRRGERKPKVYC